MTIIKIRKGEQVIELGVSNTTIVDAPSGAKWTEGKSMDMVISYYKRKNARIQIIKNGEIYDVK